MEMDKQVDILHPLASLKWKECRGPPVDVGDTAQAVWLKDKVYIRGGMTSGSLRDEARLYIYTPATDTWTTLDTLVCWFGLTTYHSQLVLVGGREYVGENVLGEPTNKLWTLSEDGQWQETLPPMPTPCTYVSAVSHGDHLLVISDGYPNKVYVYNGHHWASAQHPPQPLYSRIKSTIFNGDWYAMGWGGMVYSASLDSLLASCQPSETSQPSSLWKRLSNVPNKDCYPAVFGNQLAAVGRRSRDTTSLYAYSSLTQSWVHMADAPISSKSSYSPLPPPCAVLLLSNELMIVSGRTACQTTLTLTPFDPESPFTLRAVSLLESAAGIPVMTTLSDYTHHIQNIIGLPTTVNLDLKGLLDCWISGILWLPPSWRNLLLIIRHLLHQDELAQRMETCLSAGATEELSPTRGKQGGEEVDEQIRLIGDSFLQMEQKIAAQQQRISNLEDRNIEFKKLLQLLIKEEEDDQRDTKPFGYEEKPVALLPGVKTEPKEEPLTLEGEPHALLSAKREIKEEAIPMTKVETTSAQPTTATWNLRGVEVCGEMTAVVYSSHGQQIPWPGYGLRLNIPKGCLPAGMEQCIINIKASLAGQYEFPENSHLVSAIFWLRCEDVHKFAKPITVEIQHCAKSENVTNLSLKFVRAVCSQKQLPYAFKQLPGGNFTSHSSYGIIELNSFSGVAVTQEGSKDRKYCSRLFYMPLVEKNRKQDIDFVVSWNTEAHLTAIEINYREKRALIGPHQPAKFETDTIALDIPMEGLSIQGWKITPLMRPVVTKEQVDDFREGTSIPCCQLTAKVMGKGKKIPQLSHQIKLEGAKYPHDVFTIDLPAEGPPPSRRSRLDASEPSASGASTAGPSSANGMDTKLKKPKLIDLLTELYNKAAKWMNIGVLLGIDMGRLDAIKTAENHVPEDCLRQMLWIRLSEISPPLSWAAIAEAVELLGDQKLSDQLRTKYHVPPHQN